MDFNPEYFMHLLETDLKVSKDDFFRSDMSITEAVKVSLLQSVIKKLEPSDSRPLQDVAIARFMASNSRCRDFTFDHDPHYCDLIVSKTRERLERYFHSGELQSNCLSLNRCLDLGKAGPGASRSTRFTDFFHKMFVGPMSATDRGLYAHYVTSISPRWRQAELARLSHSGFVLVEGSKLSTVAKNAKTNRTICTEPVLNMFYQLGAGAVIEGLLMKYHNIDISVQPTINRRMARQGSLDGSFATIDLSDASDSISLKLLEAILPRDAFGTLMLLRSPVTVLPDRTVVPLHMISSMGNGFTFPLMSLVFATLVRSTYEVLGIAPRVSGIDRNYSVFGDDIIVVTKAYHVVCDVLRYCGFAVNVEKSFAVGAFRESCGGDFFRGANIRAIYLKRVTQREHVYSSYNRLLRWSCMHHVDIPRTLVYLKGLAKYQPVPLYSGDTEGFHVPACFVSDLHRRAVKQGLFKYKAQVPDPVVRKLRRSVRHMFAEGHLTAALGGYVSGNDLVTLRLPQGQATRYKTISKVTPSWDALDCRGLVTRDYHRAYLVLGLYE